MADRDTKLKIIVDAENRTQSGLSGVQRNLDSIRKSNESLITGMKAVGAVGTVAFGSLAYMTKGIVEAGAAFEQTNIAFETMLGDADLARKTLADLAQFAARTPFELPQVEDAAKRLLAYGSTAEDLIPTLRMLGDISAGVGMDKLPQLILAFGQVKAATHLTGMELRQFTEAGVPLLGALADHFHKTAGDIQEMVSDGKVGFADVQAALASLTGEGGRFNDLMEKQSHSLAGQWSNFKDQISLTARAIGEQLLPYLKPMLDQLLGIAQAVQAFVVAHPQLSAIILAGALAFTAMLAVLLPIAFVLPGLILMFTGLAAILAFIVSGPGIAIVSAIVAITAAITYLAKEGYFTQEAWQNVWLGMKLYAADAANAIIAIVESMVNGVINRINSVIKAINKVISAVNKVPGLKSVSRIGEISAADFGGVDTGLIAADDLTRRSGAPVQNSVYLTGNVLLDENAAEQIGDLLMSKLKLSNAL